MDEFEINAALDDSFNFSEVDDDILDPDFELNHNNYVQEHDLIGIIPLSSSDSEEDIPINDERVDNNCNLEATNNEFENERLINTEDIGYENVNENEESTSRGKKRAKNPSLWKRNISKIQRSQGNETISLRNKLIKKRVTGPNCKCKLECFEKFTDDEKGSLINVFNAIGDKEKQDTFLGGLISLKDVSRRRPRNNQRGNRSCSCIYKIRIDGTNETAVCKQAFCSLFGVGKSIVEIIISNIKLNIPSPTDKRGIQTLNRPNKICDQIVFQIKSHINSFPRCVSHYSRMDNSEKRYLSPELSVKKMYQMYLEKYEHDFLERQSKGEKCKPKVKYDFYWQYFNKNFNLSFASPKSDTCQTCDRLQNLINAEKNDLIKANLLDEKKIHIEKAGIFYSDLKNMSKEAKTNPTLEVLSFDYQQNMPLPHIPSGDVFYKRQVWSYNFCIYSGKTGQSYFFMYDESVGKKGQNEGLVS